MGGMMLSLHNITFLTKLMRQIRQAVLEDRLQDFAAEFYESYGKF